jgi:hypothetical protein
VPDGQLAVRLLSGASRQKVCLQQRKDKPVTRWDRFFVWYVEVFITTHPTYDRSPPAFRFESIFMLWNYKLNKN